MQRTHHPHTLTLWLIVVLVFLVGGWTLQSCHDQVPAVPDPANAVYYWRQELTLSPYERTWLQEHKVRKLYLHLFDVERNHEGQLQPRTTLSVSDLPPTGIKVIPVVFLQHELMQDTTGLTALPQLITRRVQAMMEQNGLGPLTELQVDFDWTRRNQPRYYTFLKMMRESLQRLSPTPVRLSATIRLHQLQMDAPPVDYGALMVYNVGRIQSIDEECSILPESELQPYLRHLSSYPLPLCTALPVYSWDLLFHDREFRHIVRGLDLQDTTLFQRIDSTHYQAIRYQPIPPGGVSMRGDGRIYPGDIIRHEWVTPQVLLSVRQKLLRLRPSACQQVILYHLDSQQLKQYNDEDIHTLFTGH